MSKVPYPAMKQIYDAMASSVFVGEAKLIHGWEMNDFMEIYKQEIIAEAEEETYDIAIIAPSTLQ